LLRDPYVGPRPFTRHDAARFFGRDYEARALTSLLIAERVVLLYSPSGAGKTSLVQARLLDLLERHRFEVLPIIRFEGAPPVGGAPVYSANRYLESTLQALKLPPEEQAAPAGQKAGSLVLATFLNARVGKKGRHGEVLIFDQFEDVFRLDPGDFDVKAEFFAELGASLRADDRALGEGASRPPRRWALFVIREEYLGALDPYRSYFPNRLAAAFRLNLLDRDKAVQAIQEPARAAGVQVENAAADWLADQLRQRRILRPDRREPETIAGHYVDPLQLQIVCYRLWANLPFGMNHVSAGDLQAGPLVPKDGVVDAALAGYYADVLKQVTARFPGRVQERDVRLWIDRYLITYVDSRDQVLDGSPAASQLPQEARQALLDSQLLRREERDGAFWLELAHDRLVRPLKSSNDTWYEANLSPFQMTARAWEKAGRPPTMLPRERELAAARNWADRHPGDLDKVDRDFLAAGEQARKDAVWRRLRTAAICVLAAFGIMLGFLYWRKAEEALQQKKEVLQQKKEAQQNELARQVVLAQSKAEIYPKKALLMAIHIAKHGKGTDTDKALRQAFAEILSWNGGRRLPPHDGAATTITLTDDWILTAGQDRRIRVSSLRSVLGGEEIVDLATEDRIPVEPLRRYFDALSKDHKAAEPVEGPQKATLGLACDDPHQPTLLAAVGVDKNVYLFAIGRDGQLSNLRLLESPTNILTRVVFLKSRNGSRWLCAGGQDHHLYFAELGREKVTFRRVKEAHPGPLSGIAVSGFSLVTASEDGTVRLWFLDGEKSVLNKLRSNKDEDLKPKDVSLRLERSKEGPSNPMAVGFCGPSPGNDRWLVTVGPGVKAHLWRMDLLAKQDLGELSEQMRQSCSRTLEGHKKEITAFGLDPDGRILVTGDREGLLLSWDLLKIESSSKENPALQQARELGRAEKAITDVAVSPDAKWVASGSSDGKARLFELRKGGGESCASITLNFDKPVESLALGLSPSVGSFLITSTGEGKVYAWKLVNLEEESEILGLDSPRRSPQVRDRVNVLEEKSLEELVKIAKRVIEIEIGDSNKEYYNDLDNDAAKELGISDGR
jgi:WD40 repeat protein